MFKIIFSLPVAQAILLHHFARKCWKCLLFPLSLLSHLQGFPLSMGPLPQHLNVLTDFLCICFLWLYFSDRLLRESSTTKCRKSLPYLSRSALTAAESRPAVPAYARAAPGTRPCPAVESEGCRGGALGTWVAPPRDGHGTDPAHQGACSNRDTIFTPFWDLQAFAHFAPSYQRSKVFAFSYPQTAAKRGDKQQACFNRACEQSLQDGNTSHSVQAGTALKGSCSCFVPGWIWSKDLSLGLSLSFVCVFLSNKNQLAAKGLKGRLNLFTFMLSFFSPPSEEEEHLPTTCSDRAHQ